MYAVQTADEKDLAELRDAARDGRAAAMSRRRAVAAGRSALGPAQERVRTGVREAGVPAPTGAADPTPAASNGQEPAPSPAVATNGSAGNGDSAGNGAGASTAIATNGAVASNGVSDAHLGRALSRERRRQLSQGKRALTGGAGDTAAAAVNAGAESHGNGFAPVATNGAVAANGVSDAHLGRALSRDRRRQLSQGKQALTGGAGQAPQAAASVPVTSDDSAAGPIATNGVSDAHLGRALSRDRRRQLSQGKQALTAGAGPTAGAAASAALPESPQVDEAVPGRETARARRAETSRYGGAATSRPAREGRITHAPKVIVSPTHGGQGVTGLRIGPGVRVTGDEAGASLPVSGTQYVGADGPPPAPGAGRKVGLVRTGQGLVVSGTTVRNKVPITGDEFGEHLRITGEADQKLVDDLTPRSDGTYRPAQFPRRADPHGASAVGTRLAPQQGVAPTSTDGTWRPLETTDDGWAVTGTAVGRSGRVTGNEAGACRPITGDQYQSLSSTSTECGGTGGGTAPGTQINRARLDPVTAGKVTVAQTWAGQRVTGPSVEHHPNVTGDEPGFCRPVTGTPYQGPSTAFGWCEPTQGEIAAQRLDPRPEGVAVTGDVPLHAKAVTGTERGHGHNVTGTPYYGTPRAAEAAADDWTGSQSFPVAWARRLAGGDTDGAARQEQDNPPPPSSVPGGITGSFAIGDGKVTGNNEFLFRARPSRDGKQPPVTGEGRTEGRTVTGSAWTAHPRVTGTEGYIAAGRNPSEGGGTPHGWTGARKFRDQATPGGPGQIVTGRAGWSPNAARITLSGGAKG